MTLISYPNAVIAADGLYRRDVFRMGTPYPELRRGCLTAPFRIPGSLRCGHGYRRADTYDVGDQENPESVLE